MASLDPRQVRLGPAIWQARQNFQTHTMITTIHRTNIAHTYCRQQHQVNHNDANRSHYLMCQMLFTAHSESEQHLCEGVHREIIAKEHKKQVTAAMTRRLSR
jgi:hypothetical protein